MQELNPKSIQQASVAQQIILSSWRLQRMAEAEAGLLAEEARRLEEECLQDWKAETDRIRRCYLPVPMPEKPEVPVRNEASDIYAAAFQAPKPPVKPRSDSRTPTSSPLERFLRYQSSLQSAYMRLLKQYQDLQQNELQQDDPEPSSSPSSIKIHQPKIENPPPEARIILA